MNKEDTIRLVIEIPRAKHKELKLYAVQQDKSIKDVLMDCVNSSIAESASRTSEDRAEYKPGK